MKALEFRRDALSGVSRRFYLLTVSDIIPAIAVIFRSPIVRQPPISILNQASPFFSLLLRHILIQLITRAEFNTLKNIHHDEIDKQTVDYIYLADSRCTDIGFGIYNARNKERRG